MAHAYLKKFKMSGLHGQSGSSLVEILIAVAILVVISGIALRKLHSATTAVAAASSGQNFTSLSAAFRGQVANKLKTYVEKYAAGSLGQKDLPAAMYASSATFSGMSYALVTNTSPIGGGEFPVGSDASAAKSRCNTQSPTFTASTLYLCVKWSLPSDAAKSFGNLVNVDKPIFVELLFVMQDSTNFNVLSFSQYNTNPNAGGRIYFGMSWAPKVAGKSAVDDKVSKTFSGIQYVTK